MTVQQAIEYLNDPHIKLTKSGKIRVKYPICGSVRILNKQRERILDMLDELGVKHKTKVTLRMRQLYKGDIITMITSHYIYKIPHNISLTNDTTRGRNTER